MANVVQVQANGKAPKGLTAGKVVNTAAGYYKITAVNKDGSYQSVKTTDREMYSAPAKSTVTTSSSGSTKGGGGTSFMEPWQQNMSNTYSKGPTAVQSEVERAQSIIAAGTGTPATQRYLNQMNALLNGASLASVMNGDYDNFTGYNGAYSQNGNTAKNAENAAASPPPTESSAWTKRDELSWANTGDTGKLGFDPAYTNNLPQALQKGMGQTWQSVSGVGDTAIMVVAGAAVLMAVAKVFGK